MKSKAKGVGRCSDVILRLLLLAGLQVLKPVNNAAMTLFITISDRVSDGQRLGLWRPQRLDLNQLSRALPSRGCV